jgi:hypothetical protein
MRRAQGGDNLFEPYDAPSWVGLSQGMRPVASVDIVGEQFSRHWPTPKPRGRQAPDDVQTGVL